MIFKCKSCGGNVVYSPEHHKMYCPYCESVDSNERQESKEGSNLSICPNCFGEMQLKEHTSATQCPYCDNYLILDERIEGAFAPKYIIPFQMGKENCKKLIRDKFKKAIFAPTDFLSDVQLNSMQGTYVPFWFYDFDVNCDFQGEGRKVRSWTTGNTQYTETSYYSVVRNMDINFDKIPADASIDMADDIMDLMEPYAYSQLVAFQPEYMSGFYAEKYNMGSVEIKNRAAAKMESSAKSLVKGTYTGYAGVVENRNNITVTQESSEYGLLPVWKYIYTYKEKEYPFYVNGQTGKIVGTAPLSTKKVWAYAGTLWACMTAILLLINGILG
ncbi:MAG: hypothetical protein II994_06415 [Lachnospiraceae bacterium]|nr:hypothetical protein [Lachnospiraceae bacterium]